MNFSKRLKDTIKKLGFKLRICLENPWFIIISIIAGVIIGIQFQTLTKVVAPVGQLYLKLFKMCVFPILVSGITASISRLINREDSAIYIKRIVIFFPLFLIATSGLSILMALIFNPGKNLNQETLKALGILVNQSNIDLEVSLNGELPPLPETPGLTSFFLDLVPSNIFEALNDDKTLQVLFFCIVMGIGLGSIPKHVSEPLLLSLESVYIAFHRLIGLLRYLLPFGLCGLLANQLSQIGFETLFVMSDFLSFAIVTFFIFFFINTLLITYRSKTSIKKVIIQLKEPVLLAIATQNSLACLPSSIDSLSPGLKFDTKSTNLVLPLALTLCRFGSIIYFAIATLFVTSLYQMSLGINHLVMILISSIFAGIATSGISGILTLTMLSIILNPLGLPLDAVLVLFIAIDPIIDPFRTMSIVHSAITVTSFISDQNPHSSANQESKYPAYLDQNY